MLDQVDINFEAFQKQLPKLLKDYEGKYVLLHNAKIISYFDTSFEAFQEGIKKFGEGEFSIQEVTETVESLGFYSHVGDALYA